MNYDAGGKTFFRKRIKGLLQRCQTHQLAHDDCYFTGERRE
jgi:hypothetical protein